MTMEAILLLTVFTLAILSAFTRPTGTFQNFAPALGARVENHLSVGDSFITLNQGAGFTPLNWRPQTAPPPDGQFH